MSTIIKLSIAAIGIGAMLATPAVARTRLHQSTVSHRANLDRHAFSPASPGSSAAGDYLAPRTGSKYFGPYNERIVTEPNGTVLGTDPDAFVRNQMRRDVPNGMGGATPQ